MGIVVSRGAVYSTDGEKLCSRCGREPRVKGDSWGRNCHAEYMRSWRAERRLTPEEWAAVQAARDQAPGAGRHRSG